MSNLLEYKGYYTKIEYSSEDNILFGQIEGIDDLVLFESDSLNNVEKEFHSAVDDYLAFCESEGDEPNKPYSGKFNVRIKPELHRELALRAYKDDISLNQTVEKAIEKYLKTPQKKKRRVKVAL
ncbi:MAG: type II toxin-antitoxin system HicB family antitoxin [Eubacterium sp.]|nr:type II toxin-antitoxin system HicB family antitoxin [Eubacterium sp.]